MWWARSSRRIAVVDRALVVLIDPPARSITKIPAPASRELEAIVETLAARNSRSWRVLLGPAFVEWRAVDRVAGIWRRTEQEAAVRALQVMDGKGRASVDETSIHVADPGWTSRWVAYQPSAAAMELLDESSDALPQGLRAVESLAGAVADSLRHRSDRAHMIVLSGLASACWIVKARDTVLDCGQWQATDEPAALRVDVSRQCLRHGVDEARILLLRLAACDQWRTSASADLTKDWDWTDAALAQLWEPKASLP